MKKNQEIVTKRILSNAVDAIKLIEASLDNLKPFDSEKNYSPIEREPYDALCDRFIRAVEISIKFFRSHEKLMYAENSDTLRDLLNRMEKLDLISSVLIWMKMRDVRNRIVHDYLPEEIQDLYNSLMDDFAGELLNLKQKLMKISDEYESM